MGVLSIKVPVQKKSANLSYALYNSKLESDMEHYYTKHFFFKYDKNLNSVFNYLLSYCDKKCIDLICFLILPTENVTIKTKQRIIQVSLF